MASKAAIDVQWFVIRTNPQCEQRAVASLAEQGFATFAPTVGKTIIHHRTKKEVRREFPLFVGYIFLAMQGERHWGYVRQCDGVKAVLGDGEGRPIPLDGKVIEEFHAAYFRGDFDDYRAVNERRQRKARKVFEHGQKVMITKGPYAGFGGAVNTAYASGIKSAKARARVKVMAQMLGGMVELNVPTGYLEAA